MKKSPPTLGIPLVVDLDESLICVDLFHVSFRSYIRNRPWRLIVAFGWWLAGVVRMKTRLAQCVSLDMAHLPYNTEVLSLIRGERAQGRPIVLATGSHRIYAEQVARHLGFFDRVFATEGSINMVGFKKQKALVETYGVGNFDYVGDSMRDIPVWAAARYAYLVAPKPEVERRARAQGNVLKIFGDASSKAF